MKDKPILFSTPMIQALLKGTKTQTRRLVKPQPESINDNLAEMPIPLIDFTDALEYMSDRGLKTLHTKGDGAGLVFPKWYCLPGQTLWVRETWQYVDFAGDDNGYVYRATDPDWETMEEWRWKPSIFMPREACRLHLKVNFIRVERLQHISEQDAIAEGILSYQDELSGRMRYKNYTADKHAYGHPDHDYPSTLDPIESFKSLWISINGKESWDSNPWVWVLNFINMGAYFIKEA